MSDATKEHLSFQELRDAIGPEFGENKIRAALMALNLTPYTRSGDMRRLYYSHDWVQKIINYLRAHGA